ncbi:hypothetical protein ILUMI_16041 [Ignelater luminosus]|uniref:Uncharacterized protein n=1 Tax=Ignelater luminosus TaxID=2038154 RepID=A0A8K0CRS6_IGNLU|nr:hypothetical protein ILUMI_16041 [Ignelater luminosus]
MMAVQDRVIATRNYRKYVLKEGTVIDTCKRCGESKETIEHIINGYTSLANVDYLQRHNNIAKIYEPVPVLENNDYKLYWDREVRTDIKIQANKPDLILHNKIRRQATIIDIAVPLSYNLQKTYATKINKYMELKSEIQQMWKLENVEIMPLIISSTVVISHTFAKHLNQG